jgi:hypothetical protein
MPNATPLIGGPFDGLEVQRDETVIHLVLDPENRTRAPVCAREGARYVYSENVPLHRLDPRGEVRTN